MKKSRKEKREMEAEINFFEELLKTTNHFFKDLIKKINDVEDMRHKSYTNYSPSVLLLMIILKNSFGIKSMRQMTDRFNKQECIENIANMTGEKLEELPHYDTVNDFLSKLDNEEVEKIRDYMIKELFRKRSLEDFRLLDKYWTISVDATGLYNFKKRHCNHCLKKEYRDKETEEIVRTEYYHNVLEAKLTLGDMVFSIETEFIENEDENITKQDCEINAFKRLAEKLKKRYPKLPICLIADSLYAGEPVMKICEENGWKYIIRFKDGSIPTLAAEFEMIKKIQGEEKSGKYYVNEIEYKMQKVNIVEATIENERESKATTFKYITNIRVTKRNFSEMLDTGRSRWKIENEGFNKQKTKIYWIEHINSHDYNAMKNHYLITQIADIIRQLYEKGSQAVKGLGQTIKEMSSNLLEMFRSHGLARFDNTNPLRKAIRLKLH